MCFTKRLTLSVLLFTSFSVTFTLAQDFDEVEIKTEKVTDGIYMLTGRGGNIGLCAGEDGVFMIDDQYAPLSEKIQAAIAGISDLPVRFLINTHWHGDHAGGNENFNKSGALIIAHENVRKRLSSEQFMQAFGRKVPPSPEGAWPMITFTNDMAFHFNGEDIMAMHLHNAHTDGDVLLYFPKSNVIHMGDTFFKGRFPFIDVSSGGSVDGLIKTINHVLFLVDEDTKIIPGHGSLGNKKELIEYRNMLQTVRDRIKKAIDSGMSLEEIKTAGLTKEYDESWGTGFINPETFATILFSDLSRQ